LKAIKAVPREHRHEYQHVPGQANLPGDNFERSAFFKIRSLSIIFKLRRVPRDQLKKECLHLNIKWRELVCDMPVRWNSTDKMLMAALHLEKAIRNVLQAQEWDVSVRTNLTPTDTDWACLKEMAIFFNIFRKPTVELQAEKYPTLHNAIPNYLHIVRQLNVWQNQNETPILKVAAKASHKVMTDYYNRAMDTRHSSVAVICDPRYKLTLLEYLYQSDGGAQAPMYKKAKAHFQHVYNEYKRRAVGIREFERQEAENIAIEAQGNRSLTPEEDRQEEWRINAFHGFADHVATRPRQLVLDANTEVERWFQEEVIPEGSTQEQQRAYLCSKVFSFPIICQMARDHQAIPATSAPSERVFSIAGNLISKKRTSICSENVRYVLCLRSWGLLAEDDDEEVIQIDDEGRIRPLPLILLNI
jgi:hypothetical protein